MQQNASLAVKVGIFFTLGVIIIMGLSLRVGDNPFRNDRYEILADFRQATGIEPGTGVQLRGVPIGRVESMDWNPTNYKVRVVLSIKDKYKIPQNAVAKVQLSSLLGGNFVNITFEEGEPAEMTYLSEADTIKTLDTPSIDEVLGTVAELSGETENLIKNLNDNQEKTMAKINAVIDENKDYLGRTSEQFAELGPKLNNIADRLQNFTSSLEGGEGTLGKLYADTELYEDMRSFMDSAKQIGDKINSGEGDLGKLINGDEMITEAKTIMEDLQRAAREVEGAVAENREGLRKMLDAMGDAAPRIEVAIANLKEVSDKINSSTGTIGRLVNDPSLYEDAQRAINQVSESFESGEEQGVFRSFLGVIFGALI